MDKVKQIETVVRFSDFSDIENTRFTKARCRVLYTGKNRNHTIITDGAVKKLIAGKGYANVPVIAHLYRGEDGKWRVGGHDSKFIINADGSCEVVDETIPFGVIPENCNPSFEEVKEQSGEIKKYFCVDVILWTHRYNIMDAAKTDIIYFNQSMEIEFNSYYYNDDNYCTIEDFDLSALCLLNHDPYNKENEVEPCFPSAAVGRFNLDKMSEFSVMLDELKKIQNYNFDKGEIKLDFEKIRSLLDTRYFAVQIIENSVIAVNKETFKIYSIPVVVSDKDGGITFNYDKATEKYVSVSDKDAGFSVDAVKRYVSDCSSDAVKSAETKFAENAKKASEAAIKDVVDINNGLMAELERYKAKCTAAEQKVNEYVKAEKKAEFEAHKAEIDNLIGTYEDQLGANINFINYKNEIDYSKTVEQVNNDLLIILGKFTRSGLGTVHKYSAVWGTGTVTPVPKKPDRYAGILDD